MSPLLLGAGDDMVFDLNTKLALWLESVRIFLNHTETDLKRRHGVDSKHWTAWCEKKGELFDTQFAYRFMYGLRNYLHVDMPIGRISHHARETEPGTVDTELSAMFARDMLLEKYDGWHSRMAKELREMPSEFPVMPLVQEMARCVDQLVLELMWLDLQEAVRAAAPFRQLASEAAQDEAQPIILAVKEAPEAERGSKPERLNLTMQPIPAGWPPLVTQGIAGKFTILGNEERIDISSASANQMEPNDRSEAKVPGVGEPHRPSGDRGRGSASSSPAR